MLFKYVIGHLSYLLTKRNIITIIIINIIIIIYGLITSNIFESSYILDMNRSYYLDSFNYSYSLFLKMVFIPMILLISYNYYSVEYKDYKVLFISSKRSLINYHVSKILTLFLIDLIEVLITFFAYEFILILVPYGKNYLSRISLFINITFLTLFYILLMGILSILFKSNIATLGSIILFFVSFISSSFYNISEDSKIINFFLPSISLDSESFLYGSTNFYCYLIIILILYFFLSFTFEN